MGTLSACGPTRTYDVQAYTCPGLPRRDVDGQVSIIGRAIAIEPISAPPGALNSGLGVRWLERGEIGGTSWGLTVSLWGSTRV